MTSRTPHRFVWPILALFAISGGSYLATSSYYHETATVARAQSAAPSSAQAKPTPTPGNVGTIQDLSNAFRSVHHAIKDAVVNIDTSKRIARTTIPDELREMLPPGFEMPPGHGRGGGGEGGGTERLSGTGSGVIVSADGYILTNNHVVEDADEITVRLDDGREFKAKTIGRDPKSDVAVIKIDADKLTYARLGDSDAMQVGDWVLAFGSPFGFEQSMTQGIISAKGRSNMDIIGMHNPALRGLTYENFLQTDAAINPGNSGGPLVNLQGEVIGIDTAIASRTGAYNGIGFAIPSNDAKYIMESLIKTGKIVRGYLGVGISDVRETRTRAEVKKYGYTGTTGVLVREVRPDSPGGKGGLKPGDVITAIDGKPVDTITQLRTAIARSMPGQKVNLNVFREGKTEELSFPVGEQPDTAVPVAKGPMEMPAEASAKDLGIRLKESANGVTITAMDPTGLAAEAGLNVGDTIVRVDKQPVKSAKDLNAALSTAKLKDGVRLSVRAADGTEKLVYVEKK